MRTAVALAIAGIIAASLTACSSGPDSGDCTPAASGSVSDSVKLSGDFGSEPTVEFTAPLTVDSTQRTVTVPGDKRTEFAQSGDDATVNFVLYNGTTGVKVASSYEDGSPSTFTLDEDLFLPGLVKSIVCSAAGDRVVGVIPPAEAFGANGSQNIEVAAGESLVFVVDVISIEPAAEPTDVPTAADGEPQPPVEGLPTVTLAEDGTPTITIPDTAPPSGLQIAVLKKGSGTVVGDGDTVTVQYLGMNYNTKTVFDDSWSRGAPAVFATTGVIPGFGQAMVGQAVGSQILVVIPPDLGYGPAGGTPDGSIGATDTIVFVIDILATAPAAN